MAAQRRGSDDGGLGDDGAFAASRASAAPGDGLDAARGVGWGLLLAVVGFWGPMLALWRWLHR
ncbi:MAG: hypothetical protein R3C39_07125 [Dehalococcoidia bacterium]